MYKMDYHLHSDYSMDTPTPMRAMCEAAVRTGLDEICFTEHTEMGHPDPHSNTPPDVKKWLAEIEEMRRAFPMLVIRAGIEVGDNPLCRDAVKRWHSALPLDFMLLSLHLIDNQDPYFRTYYDGKTQCQAYRRYAESKLESVLAWEASEYDAMAHLGYIAKFAPYPAAERPLRYAHAPEAFDALFEALAKAGKALEINTSGYRSMREFLPDRELLMRFRACGGEFVTLGSDAHLPEHVGGKLDDAQQLARECGFRYALTFEKRKAIQHLL